LPLADFGRTHWERAFLVENHLLLLAYSRTRNISPFSNSPISYNICMTDSVNQAKFDAVLKRLAFTKPQTEAETKAKAAAERKAKQSKKISG
jgi:hypothetical protein